MCLNAFGRAIFFQFLTVFLLVTMNFSAKYISQDYSSVEILFFRNIFGLFVILSYIFFCKKYDIFKTTKPLLHVKRSVSGNISVFFVFTAFSMLPMADMTALLSVTPLVATIFAYFLLGERVRPLSWCFILLGMIGVVFIAQPTGEVSWQALATALIAVCMVGWVVVQLRDMGRTENTVTTVFYFYLFGTIFTVPFMFFVGKVPSPEAVWFLLCCAVCGLSSQLLKTEAIKFLPVSIVTPLSHIGLIWAALYGYIFWGDIPPQHVIIGALLIIISSVGLVKYREYKQAHA